MVRLLPVLILLASTSAQAQLFGSEGKFSTRIPQLTANLKKVEMKVSPGFEEAFNQGVKQIEQAVEEEKLFCSGEAADPQGRTLPKEQKQLCFRELRKHYLEATGTIFELKKKYLGLLHAQQLERLSEIQKKLQQDIEKNF